jgi:hypothetical protein
MDEAQRLKAELEWEMLDLVTAPAPEFKRLLILECAQKIKFVKLLRILSCVDNNHMCSLGLKEAVDFFHAAQLAPTPLPVSIINKAEELDNQAREIGAVITWE